eukprot:CAMPEP_0170630568 /NCGR_PEP_ID=MMETSP0224-20130122/34083_1 /TAXON_ID=285029 /ORGANISM="Togula jolla, Strain CCCM 725" /LENGTH=67 /DNA_ID=CAMNT_0010958661 /DNA_START=18 /DNA_END=218 /DNA_ORIENTATION=+
MKSPYDLPSCSIGHAMRHRCAIYAPTRNTSAALTPAHVKRAARRKLEWNVAPPQVKQRTSLRASTAP